MVMNARDVDRYKRLLLQKRQEVLAASAEGGRGVPVGGTPVGDPVDKANADTEADLQIRLHQTDGRLLRAIEDALARISHGAYGVCEACKRSISKARLEAVPWTRHCRDCKDGEHSAA
jgi:RNA polymerase-binding protein DksA